ncbi:MAG: helix-turn-helix transcriptional regulator [Ruminococcaceae bacterium]|nr:helix-turn-helix transcriptional regulator [Oscillospiraceae bacterium]
MIDKRVGKRIKQRRKELNLTQEQFAEKIGVATNYISTIERGASFPRYEKLIMILNTLQTSADSIFCDVLDYGIDFRASAISKQLKGLPPEEQKRILDLIELIIKQASIQ